MVKVIRASVAVVVSETTRRVLLLKRKHPRARHYAARWECPGGQLEEWETFESAAVRELYEEARIQGRLIQELGELPRMPMRLEDGDFAELHVRFFLFTVDDPEDAQLPANGEHSDWKWAEGMTLWEHGVDPFNLSFIHAALAVYDLRLNPGSN